MAKLIEFRPRPRHLDGGSVCIGCGHTTAEHERYIIEMPDASGTVVDRAMCSDCFKETPSWVWGC